MKSKLLLNCLLTTSIVLFVFAITQAQNTTQPKSNSSGEDVILQWHRVLQETIRTPGQQPPTIFPVRCSMQSTRLTAVTRLI